MENEQNDIVIAYYSKGYGYTCRKVLTVNYTKKTLSYDNVYQAENIRNVYQQIYDLKVSELYRIKDQLLNRGFSNVNEF